jgi:tetratricopeptide (TPR) repeat protein
MRTRLRERAPFALLLALCLTVLAPVRAQEAPESPVALVLSGEDAQVIHTGSALPIGVKPGEILFARDAVHVGSSALTLISCAEKLQRTYSAGAELHFESTQVHLSSGKSTDEKPAAGCFLPPISRSIIASQAHSGFAQDQARDSGSSERRLQNLPDAKRQELLSKLNAAGPAESADPLVHLARASVFTDYGLAFDAAEEMRRVSSAWPDAAWARSRLFVLEEEAARSTPAPPSTEPGQTFALVIGISSFQDSRIPPLQFAHEDAKELARMLHSPRGGDIPESNIVLLTNEKATTSAIRTAIEAHLKGRAGKNDTVLLFIASHGVTIPFQNRERGFVITYDTSPEDPATSAIAMDDIHQLFEGQLSNVRRLLLYVDVCHAGQVGQIYPKADMINKTTERVLTQVDPQLFGMLAAQKNQVAVESVNYGGGHGAFTYFLLRALNGDADLNRDGRVTMDELAEYVEDKVRESTANRQIPKPIGDIDEMSALAFTQRPGIELKDYSGETAIASRGFSASSTASAGGPLSSPRPARPSRDLKYEDVAQLLREFGQVLSDGRISPADDGGAFVYLAALRARLDSRQYRAEADQLRVALEDRGQGILLRYLAGEEVPQKRDDFLAGRGYFEAAELLAPDSLYLESRKTFCEGRVAIFDKNYPVAVNLLERAVRLDPERAYSYNALGIAYLEQGNYDTALLAFSEASRRAPFWAYPLHNAALTYVEKGDYDAAIATYQRAMRLAPKVAYLPYNLGLLFQRMNRLRDAEVSYGKALALAPDSAQVWNALGYLQFSRGKNADAERDYRLALQKDAGFLAARHNLALALASQQPQEAIRLWRENLDRSPDYIPSRLSLARALDRSGATDQAIQQYLKIIAARPDFGAARIAVADLYARRREFPAARDQLQEALRHDQDSPEILEHLGDTDASLGRAQDAETSYRRAMELATSGAVKKRLRGRLKELRSPARAGR